jgi:hypothetical protein
MRSRYCWPTQNESQNKTFLFCCIFHPCGLISGIWKLWSEDTISSTHLINSVYWGFIVRHYIGSIPWGISSSTWSIYMLLQIKQESLYVMTAAGTKIATWRRGTCGGGEGLEATTHVASSVACIRIRTRPLLRGGTMNQPSIRRETQRDRFGPQRVCVCPHVNVQSTHNG